MKSRAGLCSPMITLSIALLASLSFACSSDGGDDAPLEAVGLATDEDTALTEDLAIALEVVGDATYAIATQPAAGTATVNAAGVLSYTPDADANGTDSLVVGITIGGTDYGSTVSITVNPINDTPVAEVGQLSVEAGGTVDGVLVASDVDGDTLTYEIITDPTQGTLSAFDAATGAFTYSANSGVFGPDTITFVAKDASESSAMADVGVFVSALLNFPTGVAVEPPATLLATGLFVGPLADLAPNADLIPFELNQRLWTDWAAKSRYLYLPDGTTIDFDATGPFVFPVGSFLVKHFAIEVSAGVSRNIETRVLILKEEETVNVENWVGYTYQWNESGDADLVPDEAEARIVDGDLDPAGIAIDGTALGGARQQQYEIPSRQQCKICHNGNVGFVRGFRALNLNRIVGASNQLTSLASLNIFTNAIPDPSTLGAYSDITDTAASAEERTRSYLAVNCAHCHNPGGFCDRGFDMNYAKWNDATGLPFLLGNNNYIVAADLGTSQVYQRMLSDSSANPNPTGGNRFRMPLFASNFVDDEALTVVAEFINSLTP